MSKGHLTLLRVKREVIARLEAARVYAALDLEDCRDGGGEDEERAREEHRAEVGLGDHVAREVE